MYSVVGNVDSGRVGLNYVRQTHIWWVELYRNSSEENLRAKVSGSIPLNYAGGGVLEYWVPPHGITAAPLGI